VRGEGGVASVRDIAFGCPGFAGVLYQSLSHPSEYNMFDQRVVCREFGGAPFVQPGLQQHRHCPRKPRLQLGVGYQGVQLDRLGYGCVIGSDGLQRFVDTRPKTDVYDRPRETGQRIGCAGTRAAGLDRVVFLESSFNSIDVDPSFYIGVVSTVPFPIKHGIVGDFGTEQEQTV
jgi:hypothetical protein